MGALPNYLGNDVMILISLALSAFRTVPTSHEIQHAAPLAGRSEQHLLAFRQTAGAELCEVVSHLEMKARFARINQASKELTPGLKST